MPIGINPKRDEQQQQNTHRRNAHAQYAHAHGQCIKTSTCKARIKGTCMLIVEYLSTYYIVWCACSQPSSNRHIILSFMGNVCNGKLKFRSMAIVFVCVCVFGSVVVLQQDSNCRFNEYLLFCIFGSCTNQYAHQFPSIKSFWIVWLFAWNKKIEIS